MKELEHVASGVDGENGELQCRLQSMIDSLQCTVETQLQVEQYRTNHN